MRTTSDIIAEIAYDAAWDNYQLQEVLQMDNNINAWERSGRFYFSDGTIVIETTKLVDVDSLEHDDKLGWFYNGASLDSITIREV